MNTFDEILSLRASGHVRRYHTVPHVASQSVAEHCAQALTLLFLLHPSPSVDLIKATLWHDAPERTTGDMPAPIKRDFEQLRDAMDCAERFFIVNHSTLHNAFLNLTEEDLAWLKAVDSLELFLWCHDQMAMGNRHFAVMERRVVQWIESHPETPEAVLKFMRRYALQEHGSLI